MKAHKNTPASAATPTGAKEPGAAYRQATNSEHNYTRPPEREQAGIISRLLSHGQGSAITLLDLVALTGWSGREIRKQIEAERRTGVPILSNNRTGYYLAADEVEAEQFVRSMRGRAHEILKTASAVERAAGLD